MQHPPMPSLLRETPWVSENPAMKKIDHDNWLQADTSGKSPITEVTKWREAFLSVRLVPAVPADVAHMFEAARGGMLYGYFFQPLLALAVEQCYRVLENGARARCIQAGLVVNCADSQGKLHALSFAHNLRALARLGLIADADLARWRQAAELRAWIATPAHQAALTLEHCKTALLRAADLLNKLFHEPPARTGP